MMVGIADLMYGPPQALPLTVPSPQVSMTDLMTGAAQPAPATIQPVPQTPPPGPVQAPVSTTYEDSPAPGAVASAQQQAQAAADQEPGILAKATNWAKTNPVAAQALLHGFSAMASGRTQGGLLEQLGQAAGVAGLSMTEQQAANRELEQKTQMENRKQTESEMSNAVLNQARLGQEGRAAAAAPGAQGYQAAQTAALTQRTGLEKLLQDSKVKESTLKLAELRQKIASGADELTMNKYRTEEAQLKLDLYKKLGPAQAEAVLQEHQNRAAVAGEQATQAILSTDEAARLAEIKRNAPADMQQSAAFGLNPKKPLSKSDVTLKLLSSGSGEFFDTNGNIMFDKLERASNAIMRGGEQTDDERQAAGTAAKKAVKIGQRYTFEGVERIRRD
jgi:hypothetical protein